MAPQILAQRGFSSSLQFSAVLSLFSAIRSFPSLRPLSLLRRSALLPLSSMQSPALFSVSSRFFSDHIHATSIQCVANPIQSWRSFPFSSLPFLYDSLLIYSISQPVSWCATTPPLINSIPFPSHSFLRQSTRLITTSIRCYSLSILLNATPLLIWPFCSITLLFWSQLFPGNSTVGNSIPVPDRLSSLRRYSFSIISKSKIPLPELRH